MGNPFQDQFIKAGLVNKKQVRQANIDLRTKEKEQRRKPDEAPVANAVELALQQKKEQARLSNSQRDQASREKEIAAQIKQLAETNRIKPGRGDIAFHFADANKIKKMYLPKPLIDQLSKGALGIVRVEDRYELVPAETAAKIRERRPEALLVLNSPKPLDPDDPYAEFPIPDDYEW